MIDFYKNDPPKINIRKHRINTKKKRSLIACEFGNSLRPFGNGVLRELSRQHKPNRRLDLPRRNRRLLVVPSELRRFLGEFLEDVVDETVHDPHRFSGDSDVGMNLLQDLEDVDLVCLDALLRFLLLLLASAFLRDLLLRLWTLLGRGFLGWLLLRRFLLCRLGSHYRLWREVETEI
ncbi:hypothetical protein BRARA_G01604 [Brassica rapa]|uniref:Uncharacterized protein n=1 Tax=Brassica campestris TaxID=3711 RepID=A0A397YT83_BRACM|nr:hypothetical protein BRARA_G01604 [Brassica rapa]